MSDKCCKNKKECKETKDVEALGGVVHAAPTANADGSLRLPALTDSAAGNNSLYWSTTTSKLTYKAPNGTLHVTT